LNLFQKQDKKAAPTEDKMASTKPRSGSLLDRLRKPTSTRGRTPKEQSDFSILRDDPVSQRSRPGTATSAAGTSASQRNMGTESPSEEAERLKTLQLAKIALKGMECAQRSELNAQRAEAAATEARVRADMAKRSLDEIQSLVGLDTSSVQDISRLVNRAGRRN
jgi:hypothetical protein